MAPPTPKYESVPRTDTDLDAPASLSGSDDSGSDDDAEYTGRAKRRSLVENERSRFDRETLGGQEEVERLLAVRTEKRRNKRARRGELGRMEQGGKSETSSVSGGDESPVRAREVTPKVCWDVEMIMDVDGTVWLTSRRNRHERESMASSL